MSMPQLQEPARHVSDYLSVAWRRKWLSLFVFVVLATGGLLVVFRALTPKYQAQSRIALNRVSRIMETRTFDTEAWYQTQYQVIGSSQVAAAAAVKLGRAQSPELALSNGTADLIRRAVAIDPERDNRVVRVLSKQPDAEAAALIVNAIVDAFSDITRQAEIDLANRRQQELLAGINKQNMEIESKERAIAQFAEDKKLQEQQQEQMLLTTKMAALSENQVRANVAREQAEEELSIIKAKYDAGEDIVAIQPPATALNLENSIRSFEMRKAQIENTKTKEGLKNDFEYNQINATIERLQIQHDKIVADDRAERNKAAYKAYEDAVERAKRAEAQHNEQMVVLREQLKALASGLTELNRYEELRKELAALQATRDRLQTLLIEARINDTAPTLEIGILDRAKPPVTPAWPNKTQMAIVVVGMSFILALALAFFLEYMDRTVKTPEDVEQDLRLPLAGFVPGMHLSSRNGKFGKVIMSDPASGPAEAYRKIRAKLFVYNKETHAKCFSVTSTTAGEGKTTLSSNLAIAFSQSGARVLLIDADLRHPSVQAIHEIEWAPGLGDYLAGMVQWKDVVRPSGIDNLSILPCGKGGSRSSELLESPRLMDLIREVKDAYDVVVVDTPPVLGIADSTILCNLTDSTIFVVQAKRNAKWLVRRAHGELKSAGAHVFGVVLNRVRSQKGDYYHYDRYYPKK